MKNKVTITVEGKPIVAEEGASLLQVLLDEGHDIPHLCHHRAVEPYGACRLCLVEVNQKGWDPQWRKLTTSCNFPVMAGLTVYVNSENIRKHRRTTLTLMLAEAPMASRVQSLAASHGVTLDEVEQSFDDLDRDNLCIHCALCTRICERLGHWAIATMGRGIEREPGPPNNEPPPDCVGCAACAEVCPTHCIPVTMDDGKRVIWNREFEMVHCKVCGRAHITVEQMLYHSSRTGLDESYFEVCEECSRLQTAEKFMEHVL